MFTIQHGFPLRAHDLKSLFDKTNKIQTFMTKLEAQSALDPLRYDPNDYKGDGFEFFTEIFLKSHAYDNRIGITSYTPVEKETDTGVDGIGINLSGDKSVIQIKYRSNSQSVLTANNDKLSNLFSAAQTKYGVSSIPSEIEQIKKIQSVIGEAKAFKLIKDLESKSKIKRHYVITTATGLHHYTDTQMFGGEVKCLGYNDLRSLLDNNISFWNLCREIVSKY